MTSDQAFARFQLHRLNEEMFRHKSLLERLEAAKGAVGNSFDDSLDRMIKRTNGELEHLALKIRAIDR